MFGLTLRLRSGTVDTLTAVEQTWQHSTNQPSRAKSIAEAGKPGTGAKLAGGKSQQEAKHENKGGHKASWGSRVASQYASQRPQESRRSAAQSYGFAVGGPFGV